MSASASPPTYASQQRPFLRTSLKVCGRDDEKELCRFFSIAAGSAGEFDHQLLLAHDLGSLSHDA